MIFFIANTQPEPATEPTGGGTETTEADGGDAGDTIVAQNVAFDTTSLDAKAGEKVTYTLDNQDTVLHNFALYEGEDDITSPENALYTSPDAAAGAEAEISFTAPKKPGDYLYICDYHPTTMQGTLTVQ